jgi:tRNA A37 methylthiotransferase MiaB
MLHHVSESHIKVGLVCINTGMNISRARVDGELLTKGTLSQTNPETARGWEVLPYQSGLLQAYTQAHARRPERYEFILPVFGRDPAEKVVTHLTGCDIVGFSAYVWNIRRSLKIARRLKEQDPATLIIFGGPHVPDRAEQFLRDNPCIDLAVHGEGEHVFLQIVEAFPANDWSAIPSLSFLEPSGRFVHHPKGARIQDLATIPPVYASGIFDPLLAAHPQTQWMAPIETNRGCPFSCTFCDWGSATNSKVYRFDLANLFKEMDWFGRKKIENVFCCDANYGMLPRDEEITEYIAQVREQYGYPRVFVTQNTKNSTERSYRIQKRLYEAGLNGGVTLSFQSLDATTLHHVKRANISLDSFSELQHRYTRDGITTYTDIIMGLPGETYDSFVDGFSTIIAGGQHHCLFFYNSQLLPNAEMADPHSVARFGMVTVDQEIMAVHSSLEQCRTEETPEYVQTVVATNTMPKEKWVEAKTCMWMSDLVYFGRLLQIPFVVLHELYNLEYGRLIEAIAQANRQRYPVTGALVQFFHEKARDIQNGGWEYCPSEDWLGIVWPANQYALIQLVSAGTLQQFYTEVKDIILQYVDARVADYAPNLILEAIEFNRKLVCIPQATTDLRVRLQHNLWEFYQGILSGSPVALERKDCAYGVWRTRPTFPQFTDWLEYVIFCHNNKHSYLYNVVPLAHAVNGAFRLVAPNF